jgi:DNA-binding response OmpR family regulator
MARILIVEDNADVIELLERMLKMHGSHVISIATDGEAGLKLAKSERPDLIILDLNLPKMHGHEVCEHVKSDPRTAKTKVMMLSAAYTSNEDVQRGIGRGADAYMTKPFLHTPFFDTVTKLLGAPR